MKCLHCEQELEHKPGGTIPFTKAAKFCSQLCKSRRGYELRKIRLAKSEERICQNTGCNNVIVRTNENTKTCSIECGRALRESAKYKNVSTDDGPNSNTNELIRTVNKYLLGLQC